MPQQPGMDRRGLVGGEVVEDDVQWIWDFSSTANTTAATDGDMYSPTRSRILSTRSGSGETLNSSCRQGLSPKARQISDTVCRLIPCHSARARVDQWVASFGVVFQGLDHDRLDHVVADLACRAWTRSISQALEPIRSEPVAPLGHRRAVGP